MSILRKILIIAAGFFILFIGIRIGLSLGKLSSPYFFVSSITVAPAPDFIQKTTDAKENKTNNDSVSEKLIKVIRVIDGDTIEIEGGERVRYIGIDASETLDSRKPAQCFGVEAARKNKELVEGKMARLEKDITDRDKYNRLLRYVWVGDILVNLELVKQGFAHSYSYPPDIKYQEQIFKAQQEAREAKRGLWGTCPLRQNDSVVGPTETDISSLVPVSKENPINNSCLIKGNINAMGEKIYHLPECRFYAKTKIEENRGERWFCSEDEARAAGWRRALNCPYP